MENEAAPGLDVAFESQEQSIQASLLGSGLGRIIKMQKQILANITRNFQKSKHVQKQQTLPWWWHQPVFRTLNNSLSGIKSYEESRADDRVVFSYL